MTHHPIKTLLSLAAVGTLAAVALTGCASSDSDGSNGGSGAASADQKLSYWLWQDDATDTTWTDLADEFNAQSTNGTVEMQVIPLAQYEDKLLNALASVSAWKKAPISGLKIPVTMAFTTAVNAAPMTTATASSMTLPRMMKSLKP